MFQMDWQYAVEFFDDRGDGHASCFRTKAHAVSFARAIHRMAGISVSVAKCGHGNDVVVLSLEADKAA
jgi:hypothetical protein